MRTITKFHDNFKINFKPFFFRDDNSVIPKKGFVVSVLDLDTKIKHGGFVILSDPSLVSEGVSFFSNSAYSSEFRRLDGVNLYHLDFNSQALFEDLESWFQDMCQYYDTYPEEVPSIVEDRGYRTACGYYYAE